MLALWVSALCVAHLVAGLFLARSYLLYNPELHGRLLLSIKGVRARVGRWCHPPHGSGLPAEDASSTSPSEDAEAAVVVVAVGSERPAKLPAGAPDKAPAALPSAAPRARRRAVPPIRLEWRGMGVSYPTAHGEKRVLQDVWGSASPGDLQAVMGPSGSGKSTLLDLLACRKTSGRRTGQLLVNGAPANSAYRRRAAYVPQEDAFLPVLTAEETLSLAAALKLPAEPGGGGGRADCAARVAEALSLLGLAGQASTLVGGQLPGGMRLRGLSGGERRRLCVAAALLAAPSALFLDEPTSGLDSTAALSVMTHLQRAARECGQVVVATIHQPRAALWNLFDQVTLLAGGHLVYTGPQAGLLPWLTEGLGFAYAPLAHGLPCDFALDLVNTGFAAARDDRREDETQCAASALCTEEDLEAAARLFKSSLLLLPQQQQHARVPLAAPVATRGRTAAARAAPADSVGWRWLWQRRLWPGWSGAHPQARQAPAPTPLSPPPIQLGCPLAPIAEHAPHVEGALPWQHRPPGSSTHSQWTPGGQLPLAQLPPPAPACHRTDAAPAATAAAADAACSAPCRRRGGTRLLDWCTGRGRRGAHSGGAAGVSQPSWWRQYRALCRREAAMVTRNPADVAGRLLTFTYVSIMVGLIYYGLAPTAATIRPRLNLLFSTLCFFCLMPYICMSLYTSDKRFYLADASAKMYRASAYYLAKVTSTLPFSCLAGGVFSCVVYGMAGLRPGAAFVLQNCSVGVLMNLIATQVLHLSATLTPNEDAAFMAAIAWTCLNLMFSSFFINLKEVPFPWLRSLHYVSAMYYAFEGLTTSEFAGRSFPCGAAAVDAQLLRAALPRAQLPPAVALAAQLATVGGEDGCEVYSGALLMYFGFTRDFWQTLGVLLGYWAALHAATLGALVLVARRERR